MTIDMLDSGTILVNMCEKDMQDYTLSFAEDSVDSAKDGLRRLLSKVGEVCKIDSRGKSYLVEALPSSSGCLLIISVRYVRRRYRIKRQKTGVMCSFFDIDAMLDWRRAYAEGLRYSLYLYGEKYVLIPELSKPQNALFALSEYGRVTSAERLTLAKITEHGRLIEERKASRRHNAEP